jgi:hypothetical protein
MGVIATYTNNDDDNSDEASRMGLLSDIQIAMRGHYDCGAFLVRAIVEIQCAISEIFYYAAEDTDYALSSSERRPCMALLRSCPPPAPTPAVLRKLVRTLRGRHRTLELHRPLVLEHDSILGVSCLEKGARRR